MKKLTFIITFICLLLMLPPATAEAAQKSATECTYSFDSPDDGLTYELRFSTKTSCVYIIWDKPPGAYTAQTETRQYIFGENGFLHECIFFDEAVDSVRLELHANTDFLELHAFTDGLLPDWVQVWLPSCERADMLIFPTHADDEFIWFGGLIPYYAGELDLRVQIVYMTQHFKESCRAHELLNALWYAGVENYPIISPFPDVYCHTVDDAENPYNSSEWTDFQVRQIRRFKPSVIVAQDIDGEYGHGAHILNTRCLMQAVDMAADSSLYTLSCERYGVWDTPKTYIHLYPENQILMNWQLRLEHFDGRSALRAAEKSYQFHKSQLRYGYEILEEGDYDCRLFGLFRSTVGPDIRGGDMMENIPNLQ